MFFVLSEVHHPLHTTILVLSLLIETSNHTKVCISNEHRKTKCKKTIFKNYFVAHKLIEFK